MRTVAEIDADIAQVKAELQDVHGTGTEVYARIVGYYRSVRNWNRGKREEYTHRTLFVADENRILSHLPSETLIAETEESMSVKGAAARYELFVRKTCPNCPPVKECCTNLPLSGNQIDVDTEQGFARASELGVFSAPTVIFYDESNAEIGRAHSVKEIRGYHSQVEANEPMLAMF